MAAATAAAARAGAAAAAGSAAAATGWAAVGTATAAAGSEAAGTARAAAARAAAARAAAAAAGLGGGGGGGLGGGGEGGGGGGGNGGGDGGGGGLGGYMCRGPQSSQSVPNSHSLVIAPSPPSSQTPLATAHLQCEIGQSDGVALHVYSHQSTVAMWPWVQQPSRPTMHGTNFSHGFDLSLYTCAAGLSQRRLAAAIGGSPPGGPPCHAGPPR